MLLSTYYFLNEVVHNIKGKSGVGYYLQQAYL